MQYPLFSKYVKIKTVVPLMSEQTMKPVSYLQNWAKYTLTITL